MDNLHQLLYDELRKHGDKFQAASSQAPRDLVITLVLPLDPSLPSMIAGVPEPFAEESSREVVEANRRSRDSQERVVALMQEGLITYFTTTDQLTRTLVPPS